MKITRIRMYQPRKLNRHFNQSDMVVTVETDAGLVGIGEGGTRDTLEQCAAIKHNLDARKESGVMVIQYWIMAGLIVGGFTGVLMGKGYDIAGHILLGIVGGLAGALLATILFVVSDTMNHDNAIFAIIAYTSAAILLAVKRVAIRPRTA